MDGRISKCNVDMQNCVEHSMCYNCYLSGRVSGEGDEGTQMQMQTRQEVVEEPNLIYFYDSKRHGRAKNLTVTINMNMNMKLQ